MMKTLLIKTFVVIFIFVGTGSAFGHALQKAAWKGTIDAVKRLLAAAGADVNASGDDGTTALARTSDRHVEIAKLLISNGAEVNATNYGVTALHKAASDGHVEVVKLLLSNGADVNATTPLIPALALAARGGYTEVINLLKSAGALSGNPAERPGPDEPANANR